MSSEAVDVKALLALRGKTQRVRVIARDGMWHSSQCRTMHLGSVFDLPAVVDISKSQAVVRVPDGTPLVTIDTAPAAPSLPQGKVTWLELMRSFPP